MLGFKIAVLMLLSTAVAQPLEGNNKQKRGAALPPGVKSKQMCEKYAESVWITVPNALGDGWDKYDMCVSVEPLITGGKNVESREYPHMALIGYGNSDQKKWLCGGTLISERFILSAGHCTNTANGMAKWVRLGEYNLATTSDNKNGLAQTVDYEIIERINHPNYKPPSKYNDIVLYKLDRDVVFNEYIRPICLHTGYEFNKNDAIATGWGYTEQDGNPSDILQKVRLNIRSNVDCRNEYQKANKDYLRDGINESTMLCAGGAGDNKDTCNGDSGGPLQLRLEKPYCMYSQLGITSFGVKCGTRKPGVYTRVSHFVPWIESIVWP